MLVNRTEAIQSGSRIDGGVRSAEVARLVLDAAPARSCGMEIDDELARRIARLASMAVAMHLAESTALRCRVADAGKGTA